MQSDDNAGTQRKQHREGQIECHGAHICANRTPQKAATEPTDRSMPAIMMVHRTPMAMMAAIEVCAHHVGDIAPGQEVRRQNVRLTHSAIVKVTT